MEDKNKIYFDFVFCVDLTYSTIQIINSVKNSIFSLHEQMQEKYRYYRPLTLNLRIKVIGYSNGCNETNPIFEESDFFAIPEEENELMSFLNSLKIRGCRDGSNHSLEALAMAMQSNWCAPALDCTIKRKYHCIVLLSGSSARPLEEASFTNSNYHRSMPTSYQELVDRWYDTGVSYGMNQRAKRLFVIAPEGSEPWEDLADDFDICVTLFTDSKDDMLCQLSSLNSKIYWYIDDCYDMAD